jgi:hypothetical protein
MMPEISGGCLCGKVRFTANAGRRLRRGLPLPKLPARKRQRFAVVLGFPAAAVSMQGGVKTYTDTGDSGKSYSANSARNVDPRSRPSQS